MMFDHETREMFDRYKEVEGKDLEAATKEDGWQILMVLSPLPLVEGGMVQRYLLGHLKQAK